jgi:hypothetical protein
MHLKNLLIIKYFHTCDSESKFESYSFFTCDINCQRDQLMTNKHVQWAYLHEVSYRLKPNEVLKIFMPSYELQV